MKSKNPHNFNNVMEPAYPPVAGSSVRSLHADLCERGPREHQTLFVNLSQSHGPRCYEVRRESQVEGKGVS